MDAVADPMIARVAVIKAAQVGWTELLNNIVGFHIDQDPASILVLQPTLEMAEQWSKKRLAPMLRDTPALADKIGDPRSRDSDNTLREKSFPGGYLAIVGANSPASLASRPIRLVLADEVDRYPVSAGTEGDPLKLAAKRQTTFWNRKTLIGSTPTIKGVSVIEREWEQSDQRRFYVPCPHCEAPQTLRWEQVRWDKDEDGTHHPETTHYVCEACGSLWSDVERWAAIRKGEWKATKPFVSVAGFHVPGFLSPWLTLEEIVRDFLEAKDRPELLQVFVNTVLGEAWEEKGESVDNGSLLARAEAYGPNDIPLGVQLLTAGVDTQGDRLEVSVWGFGAQQESWLIRHEVLHGDPAQSQVWDDLDALLLQPCTLQDGRTIRIRSVCIDSGGHHAAQVHAFCKDRRARRVFATKGVSGPHPIWPKRASKAGRKGRDQVFMVGVDTAKDAIYGRLKIPPPQNGESKPGAVHFPVEMEPAYFEQLTSEQVVTRYREGRPYRVWVLRAGRRNEALDCAVYALAARESLPIVISPAASTPAPAAARPSRDPDHSEPPSVEPAPQRQARRPSGWLNGGSRPRRGWL